MKPFLVVNPASDNGATGRRFDAIARVVQEELGGFEHAFTERPMHAARLARQALRDGAELVVAVGGDGTLNEVVNGFFEEAQGPEERNRRSIRPEAALGLIPRGTGGDFRKTLGLGTDLREAVRRLKGTPRAVDVGLCQYISHEGKAEERYFINIASFGVSGAVDREVNKGTGKWLGGSLAFQLASAKALLGYSDRPVTLSLDGGAKEAMAITCVAVANGRFFGGGMQVAPAARPDDGRFQITVWRGFGLADFIFKKRAIYQGTHLAFAGTTAREAVRLKAESEVEVLLDIDGEAPGRLPATFEILPGAVRLIS